MADRARRRRRCRRSHRSGWRRIRTMTSVHSASSTRASPIMPGETSEPAGRRRPSVPGGPRSGRSAAIRRSPRSGTTQRGSVGRSRRGRSARKSSLKCSIVPGPVRRPVHSQPSPVFTAPARRDRDGGSTRAADARNAGTAAVPELGEGPDEAPEREPTGCGGATAGAPPAPGGAALGARGRQVPATGGSRRLGRPAQRRSAAEDLVEEAVDPLDHRLAPVEPLEALGDRPHPSLGGARVSRAGLDERPARAAASPAGTRRPVSPSSTISAIPPTSLATTGFANIIASSRIRPKDSKRDGATNTSQPA